MQTHNLLWEFVSFVSLSLTSDYVTLLHCTVFALCFGMKQRSSPIRSTLYQLIRSDSLTLLSQITAPAGYQRRSEAARLGDIQAVQSNRIEKSHAYQASDRSPWRSSESRTSSSSSHKSEACWDGETQERDGTQCAGREPSTERSLFPLYKHLCHRDPSEALAMPRHSFAGAVCSFLSFSVALWFLHLSFH